MQVQFGVCTADARKIDKSGDITFTNTYECNVYESCDIITPRLVLSYSAQLSRCNYAYIPSWERYYYVKNITVAPGQKAIVNLSIDPLYTHRDEILSLTVNVTRSESRTNKMVLDRGYISQANRHCKTLSFSNHPFNAVNSDPVYLLTVVGGVSNGNN